MRLDRDAQVRQLERALQSLADAHSSTVGFLAGGDRRVQDSERVAPHPCHEGAFAGQLSQADADCVQDCVSCSVSERVADLGEPRRISMANSNRSKNG